MNGDLRCLGPALRRALGAAALLAMLGACTVRPVEQIAPPATATPALELAHEFALSALDGGQLALRDLRGQWVILNFWATWCGPCREEMPYLEALAARHAGRVTVLGVNMREAAGEVQAFVDAANVTFPILLNPDDAMLLWYGPRGLPLTYVIAPDGTVAYTQFGPLEPTKFDGWLAEQAP
jgi:thiol-disulfide isomerase/thioredoxin